MRPFVVFVIVTLLLVGSIGLVLHLARGTGPARFGVAGAMTFAGLGSFLLAPPQRDEAAPPIRLSGADQYVTSQACRSCHPSEYESWRKTYHRTMTRAARATSVSAPLERPALLTLDGRSYGLRRQGDEVWATLPSANALDHDGGAPEPMLLDAGEVDRRVLLTTGSHHYEAYWVEGARAGSLRLFPFVYLKGDDPGWMPRRDVFVEPPDAPSTSVRWSSNCIQCHTTAGRPGYDATDRLASKEPEVAELGIACEACHGAGGAHVQRYRDPVERYRAYAKGRADATIVNPSRLPPERASMICAACHAYTYPRDPQEFWDNGYARSFRPGEDLATARILLTAKSLRQPGSPSIDTLVDNLFYDDETVRIGGREFNGMIQSACFQRGEGTKRLSCLSCHSMHDSEPEGQLARGRAGEAACAACHDPLRYETATHTHHASGSPGSNCLGCHMPMTAYALLKSIRSHRIDSPRAKDFAGTDRPNACNLCHVDRSLAWTSSRLVDWYGQPAPSEALDDDTSAADGPPATLLRRRNEGPRQGPLQEETPAGARWLLAGDPGERAIAAAAMGEPGARKAAGDDWEAPWLASALLDPYAAVRFIARRSLLRLAGFEDVRFDPTATLATRRSAAEGVYALWQRAHGHPFDRHRIEALVAVRSTRELTLSE